MATVGLRLLSIPALSTTALLLVLAASTEAATEPAGGPSAGAPAVAAAQSDISVARVIVNAPNGETVGAAFQVSATAVVQNHGPYGPVQVAGSFQLAAPEGCIVHTYSGPRQGSGSVDALASAAISTEEPWNVRCDAPGTYSLTVSAQFQPTEAGVEDPDPADNSNAGGAAVEVRLGACGDDPEPAGNLVQNLSPVLLTLVQRLTASGDAVSEEQTAPLACSFEMTVAGGAGEDECKVGVPCSMTFSIGIDEIGGSPPAEPTSRLLPVSVIFIPGAFSIAPDAAIADATAAGAASFGIRTDLALGQFGVLCVGDLQRSAAAREGAIATNAPGSDFSSDLANPYIWPNDLNAERALVESSFQLFPLSPPALTLWSRLTLTLQIPEMALPLNVLIWRIDDLALQVATGARWVAVGLPGDAINPDPPGAAGGDPDADDPPALPLLTCAPHSLEISLNGSTASGTYASCTAAGEHMAWALIDPDAVNFAGDEGPRSDTSSCSAGGGGGLPGLLRGRLLLATEADRRGLWPGVQPM